MKIITIILIVLSSLIISGIFLISGLVELSNIPYIYWSLSFMIIFGTLLKLKFKNEKIFKYYLIKKYLTINTLLKWFDTKVTSGETKFTPMQEKAVKLWKLCLKDKKTNMSCSISNRIRHIEKNNMLIILSPINQLDYLMTIIDIDNSKSCLYEIRITSKLSEDVILSFDTENQKRMMNREEGKRKFIYNDLDKLLLREEESVKRNKNLS